MEKVLANRYALEAEIERGAIGTVWRARDLTTGEPVAVKVLLPETAHDADVVKSLLDEAEILSQLNHPSIVRPRDFVANGLRALVMDLVEGADVRKTLRTSGPLRPAEVAEISAQIADALAAVHAAGIVHGDVKPGNIMVPSDGGPAKLVDFGVARRVQLPDTVTHATPEYVAPEVVAGASPTASADVYSMGMVIYEMASARSPYRGGSVREVVDRHATCVPVQPAGMPDELWQLARHCVELNPAQRPTAEQLAAQLRTLAPSLVGRPPAMRMPENATTYRPRLTDPGAPGAAGSPGPEAASVSAGPAHVVPMSALPAGAMPASGLPASGMPASGMPASGMPVSSGPVSAGPVPGEPVSPAPVGDDNSVLALVDRTQDEATRVTPPGAVPPGAFPPGVFPEPGPPPSGKGKAFAFVAVAAALMLVLGLGAAFLIWSSNGSAPEATEPKPAPSSEAPTREPSPSPSDKPSPSETPSSEKPTEQPPAPGGDGSGNGSGDGSGSDGGSDGGSGNGRPGIGDPMPTMPGS